MLTDPPDGRVIGNTSGFVPVLSWQPVGTLAPNEYYHVTFQVKRQGGQVERWIGLDTADTVLTVSETDAGFMRTPPQTAEVTWNVMVLSQPGASWQQGGAGAQISPVSEPRLLLMNP